jgi:hypothetical protein
MSSEMKMVSELGTEAQRQMANLRWAYGERRPHLPEYLESGKRDRAYSRMYAVFRSEIVNLLMIGQAHHVLDGDTALARKTFQDAAYWLPLFEEVRQAAATIELRLSLNLMLEPIVCLLLARDWRALAVIASLDDKRACVDPQREPKAWRAWAVFMRELLSALRMEEGAGHQASELPATNTFAGYESLLNAILARDEQAFEKARAAAEAAYPLRKKKRDPGVNWFGYGKLAQVATFDALATALCALAVHRGMRVIVDSPLYPRAYIHDQT